MNTKLILEALSVVGLSPSEKIVLIYLSSKSDLSRKCTISVASIGSFANLSTRAVFEILNRLELKLILMMEKNGVGKENTYIVMPNGDTTTKKQKKKFKKREISTTTRLFVYSRDGYCCKNCKTNINLTIDHVVPISKGGSNEKSNLQTLCKSCNSKKGCR